MMKKNVFVLAFLCVCVAVCADEKSTYLNLLKKR
ncbi:MAG: hypothetical protein Ta2A_04170 [Treponemataceae bacterium]|nr:MAG: hypothetical protein Ta2A_04170 [Treponemataceae bacterium]